MSPPMLKGGASDEDNNSYQNTSRLNRDFTNMRKTFLRQIPQNSRFKNQIPVMDLVFAKIAENTVKFNLGDEEVRVSLCSFQTSNLIRLC